MGVAVSLQYFPVDFRKLGFFQPTEKASTSNKPIVATRLATQGQLPVAVQPQHGNPPVSTVPHYLAAAAAEGIFSIAFLERGGDGAMVADGPYDQAWFTAPVERPDPCAAFHPPGADK